MHRRADRQLTRRQARTVVHIHVHGGRLKRAPILSAPHTTWISWEAGRFACMVGASNSPHQPYYVRAHGASPLARTTHLLRPPTDKAGRVLPPLGRRFHGGACQG